MVCLAPRGPGEIVGPRRLSGVVVRPLNFTVRHPMKHRAKKPALVLALVLVVLLSAYGFWVYVGSLHGPSTLEMIEVAAAFPLVALAVHFRFLGNGNLAVWALGLIGFALWVALVYQIALFFLSRNREPSDV